MTWTLSAFADEAGPSADEQIKALQDARLKHIDLRAVEGKTITELPFDTAKAVKQKLDAAGISVNMFGSPIGKLDIADDFQADVDRLDHLAKMAEVFGCRQVRIFSYYNKQAQQPKPQWQQASLDRLGKLAEQARRLGLVLFHENERHIFGDNLGDVLVLADQLRTNGSFKLIFDFDNYNQSGDDVWHNWTQLRDRTDAFHLKDSNKDNMHVPIGQGNGQADRILADALARGWQGSLTLEPHLARSAAVMATGPSGQANQALKDLTPPECFQIAADEAWKLLRRLNAPAA